VDRVFKGITYDDSVYYVWVDVTDDLKGQLKSTVHVYDSLGLPQDIISFVNVYNITGGANVLLGGEKTLSGRDWNNDDSFEFELVETDENYGLDNASIKETARVNINNKSYEITLEYTAADVGKTFYYIMRENGAGQTIDGITYSESEYRIKVAVSDDGEGGVATVVTVENATTSSLNFINVYNANKTSVEFSGDKTLQADGFLKTLKENDFTFELFETDETFEISSSPIQSKKNDSQGIFTFDTVEFTQIGTYCFVIKENPDEAKAGIIYDKTVYHITVEITDDCKGSLVAKTNILKVIDSETEKTENILFVNKYVPVKAEVIIVGTKILEGRDLVSGEFSFELIETDENFEAVQGNLSSVSVNGEDGRIEFDPLSFDSIGTYYFAVSENTDSEAEYVTYDESKYYVTVKVTDDTNGNLIAHEIVILKDGEEVQEIEFINVYEYTPPVTDNPITGDNSNLYMYLMLMFLSGGAVLTLFAFGKKNEEA